MTLGKHGRQLQGTGKDLRDRLGKALRMDDAAIDAEVSFRSGCRKISDATAVARALGSPEFPVLGKLGRSGYALKEPLYEELRRLYAGTATTPDSPAAST